MKITIITDKQRMSNAIQTQLAALFNEKIQMVVISVSNMRQNLIMDTDILFLDDCLDAAIQFKKQMPFCVVVIFLSACQASQNLIRLKRNGIISAIKPLTSNQLKTLIDCTLTFYYQLSVFKEETKRNDRKNKEMKNMYRAKCLLIEKRHMSEQEAHRFIEKQAMSRRLTKGKVALELIEDLMK